MTVEEAIRSRLLALPGVTAIVGNRVYTLTFPPTPTWPAMRVQEISEVEEYHMRGPVGMRRGRVQIDAVSKTFVEASHLMAAAHGSYARGELGLSGFCGLIAPDFKIATILADGAQSMYEGDELEVVRLAREYQVFWREG